MTVFRETFDSSEGDHYCDCSSPWKLCVVPILLFRYFVSIGWDIATMFKQITVLDRKLCGIWFIGQMKNRKAIIQQH